MIMIVYIYYCLGGGCQRLLFPPWKPLKISTAHNNRNDNSSSGNSDDRFGSDNIEIDVLLKQLNALKTTCTTIVSDI